MLLSADCNVSSDRFDRLRDLVYEHCGINLHDGKQELVRARIAKQLRMGGHSSADEYLDSVMSNPDSEAFRELIDSLSTNLTSFFRESTHFDFLTGTFLPELLSRRSSGPGRRVRGWSAGCSTGEEPYSIAITLSEALSNRGGGWDARILATDISRRVLHQAQEGMYTGARVAAVPPQIRSRYFLPTRREGQMHYEVAPALRELVRFNYLNLMEPWPFTGPFDFVFCRNVMIYFDKPTQQRLVNRFYEVLASGGLLFTGHSESLTGVSHPFRYVQPTIYAKP
jgi:chemotaxis protein methyltransferase CheR